MKTNKIEGIHETIKTNSVKAPEKQAENIVKLPLDKVEISSKAKEYNQVKNIVSKAVDEVNKPADPQKLQNLKREIAIGKYRIAGEDIAEAMINPGYKKNER